MVADAFGDADQNKAEGETMNGQTRASSPIPSLPPAEIDGFSSLAELALDLRWSWNHGGDDLWLQLDPKLWRITVMWPTLSSIITSTGVR